METRRSVSKSGMVIAGRGARACDMCAKERARWYCSADEVHLCERCDKTVHTANLVAKRHERVRLGSNGVPMKIGRKRDDPSGHRDRTLASKKWHHNSKKRSISADSRGSSGAGALHTLAEASTPLKGEACILVDAKPECPAQEEAFLLPPLHHIKESLVKPEPFTPTNDHLSANTALTDLFDFTSEESELADEVPTYEPFLRELIAASHGDLIENSLPSSHSPRRNTTTGWRDEEAGGGKLENSLESSNEPASEVVTGLIEDGSISINELSEIDEFDVMDLCASSKLEGESIEEGQDFPGTEMWRSALDCTDTEAACSLLGGNPFKWKGERQLVAQQLQMGHVKSELAEDAMLDVEPDWNTEHDRQIRHEDRPALAKTLSLRLDYEEVLSAWSDRGSLWMDGQRPQIVPGDSFLDPGSMDAWLRQESSHAGEQVCQVPVLDRRGDAGRAREARVMRYKEKRQTRLFSKKIRYEVRKLNADRRPRIKGRFVKRSTIMVV